jgi:GNAT superfamily N-acetyltransferase
VRPATPNDASAVVRVRVLTWKTAYRGILPANFLDQLDPDNQEHISRLRDRLADPNSESRTFVAVAGPEIVGFVVAGAERQHHRVEAASPRRRDQAEIYAIYVLPGHQALGVGRKLMDVALEWLGREGYRSVGLWVLEANASARSFYERMAFVLSGRRQTIDLGDALTEVEYAKELVAPIAGVASPALG